MNNHESAKIIFKEENLKENYKLPQNDVFSNEKEISSFLK